MGTRFIFINLLIITSFTVKVSSGENEESSWTQLLRGTRDTSLEHQNLNSGRDVSHHRRRLQARHVPDVTIGSSPSPQSRTDHLTTDAPQMSLAQALQFLNENHGSNDQQQSLIQENQNPQRRRKDRRTKRRRRQHRNVLQDQPRPDPRKIQSRHGGTRGRRVARIPPPKHHPVEDQQIARRVSGDANKDANIDGDEDVKDAGECGPECQNLLHELDHPKEDERCSGPGQVIDIWGYCRDIFQEERRDWSWWRNLRIFVHSGGNSWYNTYRPTAYEEQG